MRNNLHMCNLLCVLLNKKQIPVEPKDGEALQGSAIFWLPHTKIGR
jgi:hypothetical protein